jgi:hypothetical protein
MDAQARGKPACCTWQVPLFPFLQEMRMMILSQNPVKK